MREIKFRFRVRKKRRKQIGYVYYTLEELLHITLLHDPNYIILSRDEWTGLKDKNGVEIYEGDIISDKSFSGNELYWLVEWSKDADDAGFALRGFGENSVDKEGYLWIGCGVKMEVIGNIHQNKELL